MKVVLVFGLLALCVASIEAKPFGWYNVSVNKSYSGPNISDIISNVIRKKIEFKVDLLNALFSSKSNYNYSYNSNYKQTSNNGCKSSGSYKKSISINSSNGQTNVNVNCNNQEAATEAPQPVAEKTIKPAVEPERMYQFGAQGASSSDSAGGAVSDPDPVDAAEPANDDESEEESDESK